jgi:hypothetical protein
MGYGFSAEGSVIKADGGVCGFKRSQHFRPPLFNQANLRRSFQIERSKPTDSVLPIIRCGGILRG